METKRHNYKAGGNNCLKHIKKKEAPLFCGSYRKRFLRIYRFRRIDGIKLQNQDKKRLRKKTFFRLYTIKAKKALIKKFFLCNSDNRIRVIHPKEIEVSGLYFRGHLNGT
jgi:hypothetical protein